MADLLSGFTDQTAVAPVGNQANSILNNIRLLFEHPTEPVFMRKGRGDMASVFQIPDTFLPDRLRAIGTNLFDNLNLGNIINRISVKDITPPDVTIPSQIGRHAHFSLFIPAHRNCAGSLVDTLMAAPTLEDFQAIAVYCRDRLNPYLFNYALSVAMMHREDTRNTPIPTMIQSFPDKFLDQGMFCRAREEAGVIPEGSRMPISLGRNLTANDLEPEQRLAYFREDLGINLHHWHWHLVYPFTSNNRAIVAKDRRGELFYHMHSQMMARYNTERFSNNLARVVRFNVQEVIPEGYFPKLNSNVASRAWPPRFRNSTLSDVNRPADQMTINMADIDRWANQIRQAIEQGYVVDTAGNQQQLDETRGIDIIGDIIESSTLNPNRDLYGDIHNMGHMLIAFVHDPDGRYLESAGVMGDSATAMRDPIFYRWHAYIDDFFQLHKARLQRYTQQQLTYPGITISSVQVSVTNVNANELQTFWQESDINMSRGLDFGPRGPVYVRTTHLQHQPFTYTIEVNNSNNNQQFGTVRIFTAPRYDERNSAMSFNEQRHFMIELDRFRTALRPGLNTIVRRSDESSVTIPYERTFRNLDQNRPATGAPGELQFNICGCGWPQHMLIPKGTEQGLQMDLFVMITDYSEDRIDQNLDGTCNDAESYCGVLNRRYPDSKPMGYPFDRDAREGVMDLNTFLTPNMRVQPITIRYRNETVASSRPATL